MNHLPVLLECDIRDAAPRNALIDTFLDEEREDDAALVRASWRASNANYRLWDDDEPALCGLMIADLMLCTDEYAIVRTLDDRYAVIWGNLHRGEGHILPLGNREFGAGYDSDVDGYRLFQMEEEAIGYLRDIAEAMMQVERSRSQGEQLLTILEGCVP